MRLPPRRAVVSNPPTMQPGLGTTQSSNDAFDDDDSEEAITDDNESNIINIVDKCNVILLYFFRFLTFDFTLQCLSLSI